MDNVRTIFLTKGPNGLGFNIIGGEGGEKIFISFIAPGGPAHVCGELQKGDQLISVDGVCMRNANHDDAVRGLKGPNQDVTLQVLYNREEYKCFESKMKAYKEKVFGKMIRTCEKKSFYVRALFSYNPFKENDLPGRGLGFKCNDILYVINASDEDWWQAKMMDEHGDVGLIPSKSRIEKKKRSRERSVKFEQLKRRSLTLSRKFPFVKNQDIIIEQQEIIYEEKSEIILTYELVDQIAVDYKRPIVVLGFLRNRIIEDLLSELPDTFASCVPHTTRRRRPNEIDGQDYHFVESMEEDIKNNKFIEAGKFNENFYGTSLEAVKDIVKKGKYCILDVSGSAIKRLQKAQMHPIVIFVKPKSLDSIREINKRTTESEALKMLEKSASIEEEFSRYFTSVVEGDTPEDIYQQVKKEIGEQTVPKIWVPIKDLQL
ncbi:PREDICTED: disks large homolog 2-like [Nicrophorus vespilloides]|uniref:Disks large homolog 2-like n=1 Tax=Nicrophorus vespilloides TaxID=110193 RepID=A0ABM1MIQ5_NICVS|nr:PREDICTED: disks large homolog 2-like [Nicrophorus vespilloides]